MGMKAINRNPCKRTESQILSQSQIIDIGMQEGIRENDFCLDQNAQSKVLMLSRYSKG
jgi:O-succinylbenzoate synthase